MTTRTHHIDCNSIQCKSGFSYLSRPRPSNLYRSEPLASRVFTGTYTSLYLPLFWGTRLRRRCPSTSGSHLPALTLAASCQPADSNIFQLLPLFLALSMNHCPNLSLFSLLPEQTPIAFVYLHLNHHHSSFPRSISFLPPSLIFTSLHHRPRYSNA